MRCILFFLTRKLLRRNRGLTLSGKWGLTPLVARDSRQTAAGKEGRDTDVGGHANACSQGGTCDGYNLFPQDKNFNNSAYKVFYENKVRAALNDPSKKVGPTTIKFYREDPRSPRPDSMEVTYTINGKAEKVMFENEAHKIPEII